MHVMKMSLGSNLIIFHFATLDDDLFKKPTDNSIKLVITMILGSKSKISIKLVIAMILGSKLEIFKKKLLITMSLGSQLKIYTQKLMTTNSLGSQLKISIKLLMTMILGSQLKISTQKVSVHSSNIIPSYLKYHLISSWKMMMMLIVMVM